MNDNLAPISEILACDMATPDARWLTSCEHCGAPLLALHGVLRLPILEDVSPELHAKYASIPSACSCQQAVSARLALAAKQEQELAAEKERKRRAKQKRLFAQSGLPAEWDSRALSLWERHSSEQVDAYNKAVAFGASAVSKNGAPRSLYVAGSIGAGKTFLASCIARDLLRRSVPLLWAHMGKILAELRASFGGNNDPDAVLLNYKKCNILILDDLGKERPTEWAIEQLFTLINYRYEHNLPLIITTNYGAEGLIRRLTPASPNGYPPDDTTAHAIVDRLCAMCDTITLTNKSYRQQQ